MKKQILSLLSLPVAFATANLEASDAGNDAGHEISDTAQEISELQQGTFQDNVRIDITIPKVLELDATVLKITNKGQTPLLTTPLVMVNTLSASEGAYPLGEDPIELGAGETVSITLGDLAPAFNNVSLLDLKNAAIFMQPNINYTDGKTLSASPAP
jgi:hypothetical protein